MSVKGKKNDEWVAATYTNFGDQSRKETLRRHFTMKAAYKAAFAFYDEEAERNPVFRKIYNDWQRFRSQQQAWFRIGETGMNQRTPFTKVEEAKDEFKKIFKRRDEGKTMDSRWTVID